MKKYSGRPLVLAALVAVILLFTCSSAAYAVSYQIPRNQVRGKYLQISGYTPNSTCTINITVTSPNVLGMSHSETGPFEDTLTISFPTDASGYGISALFYTKGEAAGFSDMTFCTTEGGCGTDQFTVYAIEVTVDSKFAPSAERLSITYNVLPASYTAPAARLLVFKNGDYANPIYKDEGIQKSGTNVVYTQLGVAGWDGKMNQGADAGKFISPDDLSYWVRVDVSHVASYGESDYYFTPTNVEVESISITPSGNLNVIKPNATATEIDQEIEALVKIRKKDGTGVVTQIPIKVDWSFEDPDDTATAVGIDPNMASGDDNAPLANGGKRGTGSILWKSFAGFTASVAADGQKADSETVVTGTQTGKTKINFSSSSVAGDNYILVAQCKSPRSGALMKEQKSGVVSVRKKLDFTNVYRMSKGLDAGAVMTVANINPTFSGDGYTDYTLGAVNRLSNTNSPEFVVALLARNTAETPTSQELSDYASSNPTTKAAGRAAITSKAQAWYDRNWASIGPSLALYINSIGAPAYSIVGARYLHPKLDGNPTSGSTPDNYPAGIQITINGGILEDPDADWGEAQGAEVNSVAFLFLNIPTSTRQIIAGRHEAGHASDHVNFGLTYGLNEDHATSGLMHPTADQTVTNPNGIGIFSDDSILRLRGQR